MSPNLRQIVNGALLGQYNGKNVSLIGCVLKLESNGSAIEIRTTDDHIIKVMLQRPMNDILNMGTYVEVSTKTNYTFFVLIFKHFHM